MSRSERQRLLSDFVNANFTPSSQDILEEWLQIRSEIAIFESRYGIDSATMVQKVRDGEIRADQGHHTWLMLLNIKNEFEQRFSLQAST